MGNIKFENTLPQFGDAGPFEATSKEDLAESMMGQFRTWAEEQYNDEIDADSEIDDKESYVAAEVAAMREELIAGLVPKYHGPSRVIFDNGGGVTLQLCTGFCHHYLSATMAATDALVFIKSSYDIIGWDNDEIDAVFEPTIEQVANGGYSVFLLQDLIETEKDGTETGWANIDMFLSKLSICKVDA